MAKRPLNLEDLQRLAIRTIPLILVLAWGFLRTNPRVTLRAILPF